MSDNDFPSSDAIRKAEEQGLVFSEDKKTLKECTNKKIAESFIFQRFYDIFSS
jgi:phage pi2 protein 07